MLEPQSELAAADAQIQVLMEGSITAHTRRRRDLTYTASTPTEYNLITPHPTRTIVHTALPSQQQSTQPIHTQRNRLSSKLAQDAWMVCKMLTQC